MVSLHEVNRVKLKGSVCEYFTEEEEIVQQLITLTPNSSGMCGCLYLDLQSGVCTSKGSEDSSGVKTNITLNGFCG